MVPCAPILPPTHDELQAFLDAQGSEHVVEVAESSLRPEQLPWGAYAAAWTPAMGPRFLHVRAGTSAGVYTISRSHPMHPAESVTVCLTDLWLVDGIGAHFVARLADEGIYTLRQLLKRVSRDPKPREILARLFRNARAGEPVGPPRHVQAPGGTAGEAVLMQPIAREVNTRACQSIVDILRLTHRRRGPGGGRDPHPLFVDLAGEFGFAAEARLVGAYDDVLGVTDDARRDALVQNLQAWLTALANAPLPYTTVAAAEEAHALGNAVMHPVGGAPLPVWGAGNVTAAAAAVGGGTRTARPASSHSSISQTSASSNDVGEMVRAALQQPLTRRARQALERQGRR